MISLDWKERLKKDAIDFFERKLPAGEFDIDIVYNAYPQRIDNKVPHAVLTLVGKTLGSKIARNAEKYFAFYDYLLKHKGDNGKIIFSYIMSKAVVRKPEVILPYLEKYLFILDDQKTANLILDKTLFPILKKNSAPYLDLINRWIKKDNKCLTGSIQKILVKLIKLEPEMIKPLFCKLETSWMYATPNMIKLNSNFLKEIWKLDPDFYLSVFQNYQNTRNPLFAEILSGAMTVNHKILRNIAENWSLSGNIKLKKIGQHSLKMVQKFKVKG
ncbi:MAG: hypothetical protein JW996_03350 [Candidatus Cloacimonetes bacterium]|nr:hypothetical protein [Candidatus Cloacimonadota bacterium]